MPSLINNKLDYFNSIYTYIDNALVKLNLLILNEKVRFENNNSNNLNEDLNTNNQQMNDHSSNNLNNKNISKSFQVLNKRTPNYSNIPVQIETAILRRDIYKNINDNFSQKFINNLTVNEVDTLNDFCKNKPFKILKCDKNVGVMFISNEDENQLAMKILEDSTSYNKLNTNITENIINNINNEIINLFNNGHIDKQWYNKILIKDIEGTKCGNLKVMPKIHKPKFGVRQIISSINHPTSKLCAFFDLMINPYIKSIKHILKDSQQLLQETNDLVFEDKLYLYSCDFESLYSNIKPDHAIEVISLHLHLKTDILRKYKLDLISIRKILQLIFENNIFKYKDNFFIQKIGIPMGCIAGPTIANIYIYILEADWLNMNPEIIYYRFIDDIFIAAKFLINLEIFKALFLYLKLNIEQNDIVSFLDLLIKFDSLTNQLHFNLYIKPTNTHGYLLTSSNHPKHVFTNIIVTLVTRIRRICTSYSDYLLHTRNLMVQLIKRKFDFKTINNIIIMIGNKDRNQLLPYKSKVNNVENKFKLFIKYDFNYEFLNRSIYELYKKLSNDYLFLKNKKLLIVNNINYNLGAILINDFKLNKSIHFKYKKCNNTNCTICKFSLNYHFFNCRNLMLPFKSHSTCHSLGIIYIIFCMKCKLFYIGESERSVKKRIGEHINKITFFKKNIMNSLIDFDRQSEVAIHFNQTGHNYIDDFRFCIFESNVINKEIRRSIETDLINIFKNSNNKIINSVNKQPSLYNIKYFTFQDNF